MQFASFVLNLMTKHKLPATSVDDILKSTAILITFAEELKLRNENSTVTESLKQLSTPKL